MVHLASRGLPLDAWEGLGVEGQVCLLLTCPREHECGATCVTLGMWTRVYVVVTPGHHVTAGVRKGCVFVDVTVWMCVQVGWLRPEAMLYGGDWCYVCVSGQPKPCDSECQHTAHWPSCWPPQQQGATRGRAAGSTLAALAFRVGGPAAAPAHRKPSHPPTPTLCSAATMEPRAPSGTSAAPPRP